jgi:hypothetical protein
MALSYNPRAVKAMLVLTVPCAGPLGLIHMIAPSLMTKAFGTVARKTPYLYSDAFMGCVFLAFATTAAIGLLSPNPGDFWPLIILQCAYKVYHLLAFLGTHAEMDAHNMFYVAGWLAFIAGDIAVFATRERKPKGKQT